MPDVLEDLLRACTVRVLGGPTPGAGFFVAPGTVVTCVHVIGDSTSLSVRWERDGAAPSGLPVIRPPLILPTRGRAIRNLDRDYPDVAVLTVKAPDGHPCVRMDLVRPEHGDRVVVFGYPEEGGSVHLTPAVLAYRGLHGTSPTSFWDLGADTVKPGMSGAAALHLRTGVVGGIVVASKNPARGDGALAVPWHELEGDLSAVLAANRAFHEADYRWNGAAGGVGPGARPPAVPETPRAVTNSKRVMQNTALGVGAWGGAFICGPLGALGGALAAAGPAERLSQNNALLYLFSSVCTWGLSAVGFGALLGIVIGLWAAARIKSDTLTLDGERVCVRRTVQADGDALKTTEITYSVKWTALKRITVEGKGHSSVLRAWFRPEQQPRAEWLRKNRLRVRRDDSFVIYGPSNFSPRRVKVDRLRDLLHRYAWGLYDDPDNAPGP